MILHKYSNSITLKELSLRNLNNSQNLDLDFINKVDVKFFFSLNNYSGLKNFNSSFFIFSYLFTSIFLNTFKLKLSFSKKVFIKRRKKQIKRQVNGFIFILKDTNDFYSCFQNILYNYSILPLYISSFKNLPKKKIIDDSSILNLNVNSIVFFNNYFNNLLYYFQLSNNFFISFFYKSSITDLILYFFLRSLGFNFEFKKIKKI
jgi:hypothetical protein